MNIYIDTEFNSFQGELISVALCAEDGQEFYEVLHCKDPHVWVEKHVMPILNKAPLPTYSALQDKLQVFLRQYKRINIIADWPDDIRYFCELLITGPGENFNRPPTTMEIRPDLCNDNSKIPHNALEDARAIRTLAVHRSLIPKGKTLPQTVENLQNLMARDGETLLEMKAEIAALKGKLNQAEQAVAKLNRREA